MYAAGKLPDYVTRTTHRSESRWMIQTGKPHRANAQGIIIGAGFAAAMAGICWAAMVILGAICA